MIEDHQSFKKEKKKNSDKTLQPLLLVIWFPDMLWECLCLSQTWAIVSIAENKSFESKYVNMHRLKASDFTRLDDTLPCACVDDSKRKPCVRRGLHNSRHNMKSLCSPQYVAVINHTVKSKLSNETMCLHSLKHLVFVCACVCDIFFFTAALYWSVVLIVIF